MTKYERSTANQSSLVATQLRC